MKRYKVLQAVLSLGEFTTHEIATLSGVNPKTVRSVLSQYRLCWANVERRATGRRGGQATWMQLSSAGRALIEDELRQQSAD